MAVQHNNDVILMTQDELIQLNLTPLYLNHRLHPRYYGEWGSQVYTKEEYLNASLIKQQHYRTVDPSQVAVCVYDIRLNIAGHLVGKLIAHGQHAAKTQKAIMSRKGIRVYPRIGWVPVERTFGQYEPIIITFDVSQR